MFRGSAVSEAAEHNYCSYVVCEAPSNSIELIFNYECLSGR